MRLMVFSTQCPWLAAATVLSRSWHCLCPRLVLPSESLLLAILSHSALIAKYQVQLSAAEVFLATPYCPGIRAMPQCDFKQMLFFDPVLSRFNLSLGVCRVTLIFCVPTFDPPMPML